jgi:hypothetical protein
VLGRAGACLCGCRADLTHACCCWQAGCAGTPTVFLFSDSQMKLESQLEDINNILNTGEA